MIRAPELLLTRSPFKTYSCHSVVSLGKTLYGTFLCLAMLSNYSHISIKLQEDRYILASPEAGRMLSTSAYFKRRLNGERFIFNEHKKKEIIKVLTFPPWCFYSLAPKIFFIYLKRWKVSVTNKQRPFLFYTPSFWTKTFTNSNL